MKTADQQGLTRSKAHHGGRPAQSYSIPSRKALDQRATQQDELTLPSTSDCPVLAIPKEPSRHPHPKVWQLNAVLVRMLLVGQGA